ncbi:hypothetical protein BB050_00076 [Flavobacterium anhuiense]|uniref:Phosphoribosyltransferase n=1 Tax=Flavobacterium anhuiense TaxID=459526 RepID=A0AAC9CWH8_9FLAO|nr:hypothetical protein [Flavobacterium anhuiense]AOC93232.1 hypothetical protein BB050_00076 [Flavobacterium anhuiense]
MIRDYQEIINVISDRFSNSLSQLDIITWLENFDKTDWKKALTVLNNFEYYSTKDIIKEYENGLQNIINNSSGKIFLIPVGNIRKKGNERIVYYFGKSGSAMVYYLKKTPSFTRNSNRLTLLEESKFSELPENATIVLVDDFSGTGGTILEYYNKIKTELPEKHTIIVLTVAFMEKAEETLKKSNIHLIGNKKIPAFSERGSVFGYYPKMKAIRDFCFRYGNDLYSLEDYNNKNKQHPLGYQNTQALIGFEHSIPNNTLSIIWADCKNKNNDTYWSPLFPRRGNLIIERSKEFKQNQSYWVSILYKLGLNNNLFNDEEKYQTQTIQLVSILYLKRKQKSDLSISLMLGININEYDSIINIGKEKNLFDNNGKLTTNAINIIELIRKKIKFQNNSQIINQLKIEEDIVYVPKVFQGSS